MGVAISRSSINNFCRKIIEIFLGEHSRKHSSGELFLSNRRHFVIPQQKLLIELQAIATLTQIKNLFELFISDKPEPGYHLRHEHTSLL